MPRMGEVATSITNTLLPSYASGEQEVFWQVGGLAAEAVHYFDGDGGSIFVDRFPGLIRYLRVKGIPIHSVNTPRCNLVYFREVFHDAIELGHQYTIAPVEDADALPEGSNARPQVEAFGHLSLVHARNQVGRPTCGRVLLVPHGVHHGRNGDRLLVELYTCNKASDQFVSTGVRRVEDGLSFPTRGAPQRYLQALETARAQARGVFQFGQEMGHEDLMPWVLKERFAAGEPSVTLRCGTSMTCSVTNSDKILNESHLMVLPSLVRGAGSGLMVRPTPPGRQDVTIPSQKYLCFFATRQEQSHGPDSDYVLESARGPRGDSHNLVYDPQVYDGKNIGRFVNQAGLCDGIKALVASCDRESGCETYAPGVAEKVFDAKSNCGYKTRNGGREMVITAKVDITTSSNEAIELYANYGLSYWMTLAVRDHLRLGHDCDLVKGVFWLLLSSNSCVPEDVRAAYITPDRPIAPEIVQLYAHATCPFPPAAGKYY